MMNKINRIRTYTGLLLIMLMILPFSLSGQHEYPTNYFRSPVDFRILLSGTFGELRSGHFHSGMDIKTGGVSGKKIYAIADGYVSRIKVSPYGFGKTLYVTHPNGFVSVYAHLSRFNKAIASYVKATHYELETYALDIYPEKGEYRVKKGEVIAYSGNSGGSNGPHLHFEMRIASSQTPVNPLFFGYSVKDYIRPEINWLKVIPVEGSQVDGKPAAKVFQVDGWGEQHRIKDHDTITVSGPFSVAINTIDKLNDANNKNGVYSIMLNVDGKQVYYHDLEKFDFHETAYLNSLIDYGEYIENKRRYQRTEIDPNNKLSIYEGVVNDGIIHFEDTALHKLEYVVKDFNGNISRLPINIRSTTFQNLVGTHETADAIDFSCYKENVLEEENIALKVPGKSLYRNLKFEYSSSPMVDGTYSRVYHIHNNRTPLRRSYSVTITPDRIPVQADKLLLARITDNGEYISLGGKWVDGKITASIKTFGDFTLLVDTIPPEIQSVNIASGIIKPDRITVKVRIKDELSGIKKFHTELNGEWILMDYDAKNNLLIYYIDERLNKGENKFRVVVKDQRDNESVFTKTLVRQ